MLRALTAGLSSVRRAPLVHAVAVGTIAVSLLLVGMVRLAAENVGRLAASWGRNVQVIVYLEDGVSAARARKIAEVVGRLPGVDGVRQVEPAEALERLRGSLGDRAVLLDGVEDSLLPTSLEVTLRDGHRGTTRLRPEIDRLRRAPGVEDVEVMGDWVERLVSVERTLHLAGWLLAALVALACVYIISSTIRLGVFARREEIEILKLVGATDRFVQAPFLVEGLLQGLIGAGLSLALLYGMFRAGAPGIEQSLGSAICSVPLAFLAIPESAGVVALGAVLGLVGSSLAVSRHVRAA